MNKKLSYNQLIMIITGAAVLIVILAVDEKLLLVFKK